jgi:hypothetical protein
MKTLVPLFMHGAAALVLSSYVVICFGLAIVALWKVYLLPALR